MEEVIAEFKKVNIETTPPTTPYIPKSSTPKVANTTLEVYRLTPIVSNIRMYNINVFFAMRLLFSEGNFGQL